MSRRFGRLLSRVGVLALGFAVGCSGSAAPFDPVNDALPGADVPDAPGGGDIIGEAPPPAPVPKEMPKLTPEQTRAYLSQLAPLLTGRELSPQELEAISNARELAIAPILEEWVREPGFVASARLLIEQLLFVSGSKEGVDFNLPGNLAAHVVKNDLPFSTLLTADYCVDAAGVRGECDTGAPFKAGVVGTRAYLISRKSRFNLTRASTLMKAFACSAYPLVETLQPRIEKTRLIPMFQAQSPEEQTDPNAQNGFGNGFGCYTCHGQFSLHAQVFVRFDETGMWRSDATGQQDPAGELGRSIGGLYASHLKDALEAAREESQVFGKPVANLREAAIAIAESPAFVECQIRNVLEYTLNLDAASPISRLVLQDIATKSRREGDPTFAAIVTSTFTHPSVVEAVLGLGGSR